MRCMRGSNTPAKIPPQSLGSAIAAPTGMLPCNCIGTGASWLVSNMKRTHLCPWQQAAGNPQLLTARGQRGSCSQGPGDGETHKGEGAKRRCSQPLGIGSQKPKEGLPLAEAAAAAQVVGVQVLSVEPLDGLCEADTHQQKFERVCIPAWLQHPSSSAAMIARTVKFS